VPQQPSPSPSACTPTTPSASCPGSAPLADLAADVGAHHERLDASGYPLGLTGQGVPLGARILAAVDTWAERSGDRPPDLTADKGLDPACLAALRSWAKPGTSHRRQNLHTAPALSSRELEVLRLLAEGATTRTSARPSTSAGARSSTTSSTSSPSSQ
jgi:hypothetical protein